MFKNLFSLRFGILLIGILILPLGIYSQDLGSSNDLFRKPATKKKSSPKKTSTPKRETKNTTSRKKAPTRSRRRASSGKRTSRKAKQNLAAKPETTEKSTNPNIKTKKNKNGFTETIINIEKSDATAEKEVKNPVISKKAEDDKKIAGKKVVVIEDTIKKQNPPIENAASKDELVSTTEDPNIGDFNESFESAIEQGNKERNARNYMQAEAAYTRARSLNKSDYRAIYGLGNLYSDQQRWEEAEKAYKTAIRIEPDDPTAYIALSYVLTQPIAGVNLLERYAEAEKAARRAIKLDDENPVAFDQLGVALELQGNISDETLNAYQKAIKLDPTFALAYAHLGRILRRKGEIRESSKAYINSIQLSVDVPTMILVGEVMQSQQRYQESEQLLRRALKQDPKNPTALYLLGRALTVRNSFEEAEEVLKKSAKVSPNSFVAYQLLGSLFLRRGNYIEAENYLREALKVISPNEKKRLSLEFEAVGDGLMQRNRLRDATRVYTQALMLDKNNSGLADKLAKSKRR